MNMNKRLYVGMITLLMGSIITCGTTDPSKKVGMVDFYDSNDTNKESVVFIDYKCIENEKAFEKIEQQFWKEMNSSFWNGKSFGERDSCKAYTQEEMDRLLHDNNKSIFLQSLQVEESEHEEAQQGWKADKVYFLDTQGNPASDTKANYFSGKAKVLSMDSNTLNIDTPNDGNNDNDDFKMPISNNDNSNISSHEKSDDNDGFNTSFVQENNHDDSTPASNEKNEYMTLFDKLSPHNKAQNNSNFHPAYLLLLIPLALIAWVALPKEPTQDKSKDEKAAPSPTQADPVQAAA